MKTMVVLSGGMDSATLLYKLKAEGHECQAITVYYGQRHWREVNCARNVCRLADIQHHVVEMPDLRVHLRGSSQTDSSVDVPEGRYDEEVMKKTVVPNRNMILLAIAGGVAIANGCRALAYGAHAGDHAIYPDCRPSFVEVMRQALLLCDWNLLDLKVPFIDKTKGEIVRMGLVLGVPFEQTWTCYVGGHRPCMKCGACVERAEAFSFACAPDPLIS
jgi:7-cyano-7-deazaguanine synthase